MKIISVLIAVLAGVAPAGVYRDAGLGMFPFLKMDVGATASALGGTGAVNGGELAIFSNPALVAGAENSVSAGYNQWYGETVQNYLAAVSGLGGVFTGSLAARSVFTDGIEYRETPSSNPVDTFSASDLSLNGAVAARLGRFDVGAGIKFIHEKVWLESTDGWAVDVGFNYHPHSSLVFAAAYMHSGPSVTMDEQEFRLPRTWVFASKWKRNFSFGTVSVSGQVMRPLDNRTRAGIGLEYSPFQLISLRGGWKFNDDSGDLTAGAGLTAKGWTLEYAFVPGNYSLGTAHRFSLSRTL